ncbi:hypothetical protein ACXZ66_06865 [Corynebacterium sp. S7]
MSLKRCLRCGCHRPRLDPDPKGLGLCEEHYNQLSAGTIGQDHNPRSKERTVEEMEDYLLQAWEALGTIPKDRALARQIGVPKDTIHHIMGRTWPRFRTAAWIPFTDGVARLRFHHEHPEANQEDDGGQWDQGEPPGSKGRLSENEALLGETHHEYKTWTKAA